MLGLEINVHHRGHKDVTPNSLCATPLTPSSHLFHRIDTMSTLKHIIPLFDPSLQSPSHRTTQCSTRHSQLYTKLYSTFFNPLPQSQVLSQANPLEESSRAEL